MLSDNNIWYFFILLLSCFNIWVNSFYILPGVTAVYVYSIWQKIVIFFLDKSDVFILYFSLLVLILVEVFFNKKSLTSLERLIVLILTPLSSHP